MENNRYNHQSQHCPRNGAVYCAKPCQCSRCGWNPDVAAARLERIKEAMRNEGKTDEPEKG